MAQNKTQYTEEDVSAYLATVENELKKSDSLRLIEWMEEATGEKAKMFGPSIIGFGQYRYQYDSGHSGEAPLLGFSPRKSAFSLYVYSATELQEQLLQELGKFTMGKACIYIKKLSDISEPVLKAMMKDSVKFLSEKYQRV